MNEETDLGPAGPAVYLRIEHHDGTPVAVFATDDGGSFALAEPALRRRIAALQRADEESREERQALCALECVQAGGSPLTTTLFTGAA